MKDPNNQKLNEIVEGLRQLVQSERLLSVWMMAEE
jgi:hypothetical protein